MKPPSRRSEKKQHNFKYSKSISMAVNKNFDFENDPFLKLDLDMDGQFREFEQDLLEKEKEKPKNKTISAKIKRGRANNYQSKLSENEGPEIAFEGLYLDGDAMSHMIEEISINL
jgi:hypothetical protein